VSEHAAATTKPIFVRVVSRAGRDAGRSPTKRRAKPAPARLCSFFEADQVDRRGREKNMKTLKHANFAPPMILGAKVATDLMTPNPVSIRDSSTVLEAAAFLAARGISAAPVIGEAGRPIGVVSRTDILQHRGRSAVYVVSSPEEPVLPQDGAGGELSTPANVCDVMTPGVFCVAPDTPVAKVVEKMVALEVRRLFVVDDDGIMVGVVSAVDVLRKLRRWGQREKGR
jgi:CBS domain-containing protein